MTEVQSNNTVAGAQAAVALSVLMTNQYNFRKDKDTGNKRPSLSLEFEVPSAAGLVDVLQNGTKEAVSFLTELAAGTYVGYIKGLVDNDLEFSQEKLDAILAEKPLTIQMLATLPRSERSSANKDDIDNFAATYRAVMAEVLGIEQEKVDVAADIFAQRLKPVLAKPKMLEKLKGYLASFADVLDEASAAEHEKAITWFAARFDELLSANLDENAI